MTIVLNIPGYQNSLEGHWQTFWENEFDWFKRVKMPDWENPKKNEWLPTLIKEIENCKEAPVLLAHSLGCPSIALLPDSVKSKVKGAFMVACPDLTNANIPPTLVASFTPVPKATLPFPSILIASLNDPYCKLDVAKNFANCWGSHFINLGPKEHISYEAVGTWDFGKKMFLEFINNL